MLMEHIQTNEGTLTVTKTKTAQLHIEKDGQRLASYPLSTQGTLNLQFPYSSWLNYHLTQPNAKSIGVSEVDLLKQGYRLVLAGERTQSVKLKWREAIEPDSGVILQAVGAHYLIGSQTITLGTFTSPTLLIQALKQLGARPELMQRLSLSTCPLSAFEEPAISLYARLREQPTGSDWDQLLIYLLEGLPLEALVGRDHLWDSKPNQSLAGLSSTVAELAS